MSLAIRVTNAEEFRKTEEITREAFWNHNNPGADEHYYLNHMRNHSDFIKELDFVVTIDDKLAGNIVFMKAKVLNPSFGIIMDHVISFGPISVLPEFQKRGVGKLLIHHSFEVARKLGFKVVIIYGDPTYYGQLGFRCAERYDITTAKGNFQATLMAYELQPNALSNAAGVFHESSFWDELSLDGFDEFDATFPEREKLYDTPSQRRKNVLKSIKYKACESLFAPPVDLVVKTDNLFTTAHLTSQQAELPTLLPQLQVTPPLVDTNTTIARVEIGADDEPKPDFVDKYHFLTSEGGRTMKKKFGSDFFFHDAFVWISTEIKAIYWSTDVKYSSKLKYILLHAVDPDFPPAVVHGATCVGQIECAFHNGGTITVRTMENKDLVLQMTTSCITSAGQIAGEWVRAVKWLAFGTTEEYCGV